MKTKRTAERKPIPFDEVVKRLLDTPSPHRKQPKPHKPAKTKN